MLEMPGGERDALACVLGLHGPGDLLEKVHRRAQLFTDLTVPEDPAFFLLHCSDIPITTYKKSVLRHLLDTAKRCITLRWKEPDPLTIQMWLRMVEDTSKMEDLLTAQNKHERYKKTWLHWNMFIYSEEGQSLLDGLRQLP